MIWANILGQGLLAFTEPPFVRDALNMIMALGLGAIIGFERQWRQRLAGLRTNRCCQTNQKSLQFALNPALVMPHKVDAI